MVNKITVMLAEDIKMQDIWFQNCGEISMMFNSLANARPIQLFGEF